MLAFFIRRTIRIVVQNNRQFSWAPRLLQQIHSKLLTLPPQFKILRFTFLNKKFDQQHELISDGRRTGSANAKFRSSHESWNAVNIGSLEESAINDGLARARYSLILDRACLSESSSDSFIQSSHPHLWVIKHFKVWLLEYSIRPIQWSKQKRPSKFAKVSCTKCSYVLVSKRARKHVSIKNIPQDNYVDTYYKDYKVQGFFSNCVQTLQCYNCLFRFFLQLLAFLSKIFTKV